MQRCYGFASLQMFKQLVNYFLEFSDNHEEEKNSQHNIVNQNWLVVSFQVMSAYSLIQDAKASTNL